MAPVRSTWAAKARATTNVAANPARLMASMIARLRPRKDRTPVAAGTSRRMRRIMALASQSPELAHVHGFEALADAIDEYAEHHDGHQHVERDAEFDNQRHSIGQGNCGQEQAVLERQQRQYLCQGLAPVDHH